MIQYMPDIPTYFAVFRGTYNAKNKTPVLVLLIHMRIEEIIVWKVVLLSIQTTMPLTLCFDIRLLHSYYISLYWTLHSYFMSWILDPFTLTLCPWYWDPAFLLNVLILGTRLLSYTSVSGPLQSYLIPLILSLPRLFYVPDIGSSTPTLSLILGPFSHTLCPWY